MSTKLSLNTQSDRRSVSNSFDLAEIFESQQETDVAPDFPISRNDYYKLCLLEMVHASSERSNLLKLRSLMLIARSEELCKKAREETERLHELRLETAALLEYQRK